MPTTLKINLIKVRFQLIYNNKVGFSTFFFIVKNEL